MTNEEIVKWLRSKKVETGSLLCLGCGYEHHCGIHGCAVMRAAADAMENLQTENAALRRHIDNLTDAQAVMVKEFTAKLEELAEVKEERDAAVEDLRNLAHEHSTCYACINDKFDYDNHKIYARNLVFCHSENRRVMTMVVPTAGGGQRR